ncbi:MAG: hypothetical protein Q9217_006927, partial [Psora testacea]
NIPDKLANILSISSAFKTLYQANLHGVFRPFLDLANKYELAGMNIKGPSQPQGRVGELPYWEPDEFDFESLERYCDGGFCPVSIWQTFHNGRYRIAYKLGNGHFSTVWLAQDLHEKRYVALKILTADQFGQSSEADMLRAVASFDGTSLEGEKYIPSLLASFDHESANGKHHVLVLPVSRPLIGLRPLNMDFRAMAKDLVMGLDRIHAAGIVHGDIHTSNIGYQMQNFSDEQLEEIVPPESHIVPPMGGRRPPYLVSRQEWLSEKILDKAYRGHIVPQIHDYGSAFKLSAPLGKPVAVPESYRPPEHIFNPHVSQQNGLNYGELNKETDIWALGATRSALSNRTFSQNPRLVQFLNMASTSSWLKYPVKVTDGTNTVTVYIYCETFRPTDSETWQLQAAAAYAWSAYTGYTHLILIGAGHHQSSYSPTEADHLTLKPFDQNDAKLRTLVTAHVYIPNDKEPWTGEWFRKDGPKNQGPTFVANVIGAVEQAETTLNLSGKTVTFTKLTTSKAR